MKKIFLPITLGILLSSISCDSNDQPTNENCKLATVTNYEGVILDEEILQVTYQNDQITKLSGPSIKYDYQYDSQGRVTVKTYTEIAQILNPVTIKVEYSYNADNTLNEEKYSKKEIADPDYELRSKLKYLYNNGKISNGILYKYDNTIETLDGTANYYYTGNNISKIEFDGDDLDTLPNYQFDFIVDLQKANPFASQINLSYPMDTYIDDDADNFITFVMLQNPNRLTSYTFNDYINPETYLFTYNFTTSPQGNQLLSEIFINNEEYYKFSYNCN